MPIDRPGSGDQPHEADRPQEAPELRGAVRQDIVPLNAEQLDANRKEARGELRWSGSGWVESEPFDHVKRQDRAERMRDDVELPEKVRELPNARDVLPNLNWAEVPRGKFEEYSLNPEHPHNNGKAEGWRALGYDVDDPDARCEAAHDLKDLISHELLRDGKVDSAHTRETSFGVEHRVLNGFIGPNDRHGTLVTCWLVADPGERGYPKLVTTWVQPHRDKESDR